MASAYEILLLESDLPKYAHDMLDSHVVGEYQKRISLWKQHFNLLVDAQHKATEAVKSKLQTELDEINKKKLAADEFWFGLGMLALSLATGPLISFVAGKIEHVWYPKYAPTVRERAIRIKGPGRGGKWQQKVIREEHYDEVHAKAYGDFAGQVTGLGINGAIKVILPDPQKIKGAVLPAEASSNVASFRTNLDNSLLQQSQVTIDIIKKLAFDIRHNPDYGRQCLEKLSQRTHGHVNPAGSYYITLKSMAERMIREDIDRLRREWAADWFFFGSEIPTTSPDAMAEAIEIELWASWLLNEEFKLNREDRASMSMDPNSTYDPTKDRKRYNPFGIVAAGKTFPYLTEGILVHLHKFGVVEARSLVQKAEHARREEKKRKQREGLPPIQNMDEFWRRREQLRAEDEKERQARPLIEIGAKVDSVAEIRDLERWALSHPPKLSAGQLQFTRRMLPSFEKLYQ